MVKIWDKNFLKIEAFNSTDRPWLKFNGAGAININNSSNITIKDLHISGPNLEITGA